MGKADKERKRQAKAAAAAAARAAGTAAQMPSSPAGAPGPAPLESAPTVPPATTPGTARPRPPEPVPSSRAIGVTTLRRILAELDGSKLCYGEPVHTPGATVIPVSRVWAAGGVGYGSGEPAPQAVDPRSGPGGGGGGGGAIEAHPVGFITVGADGTTRYESIPDPQGRARAARMLATGAATLLTAVATSRAIRAAGGRGGRPRLGRRRGATRLLPRGD